MLVSEKGAYTLIVRNDSDPSSPREDDNLGNMICFHRRYNLGDQHQFENPEEFLRNLVEQTVPDKAVVDYILAGRSEGLEFQHNGGNEGWALLFYDKHLDNWDVLESGLTIQGNEEDMAELLIEEMDMRDLLALAGGENCILPLYLFDHSGLTMSTAPFGDRWDSGQVGWIYASKEDIGNNFPGLSEDDGVDKAEDILRSEVETFDLYLRGECYGFELLENGITVDSCWGFLGDFKQACGAIEENLPDECAGMTSGLTEIPEKVSVLALLREAKIKVSELPLLSGQPVRSAEAR